MANFIDLGQTFGSSEEEKEVQEEVVVTVAERLRHLRDKVRRLYEGEATEAVAAVLTQWVKRAS